MPWRPLIDQLPDDPPDNDLIKALEKDNYELDEDKLS